MLKPSIALFALFMGTGCWAQQPVRATIYRDSYGVPSIQAKNLPDAMYALGYLHASDDGLQMALNYKLARGRMAEVRGSSQLLIDGVLRSIGFEDRAEQAKLTPPEASIVDSYLAGANR